MTVSQRSRVALGAIVDDFNPTTATDNDFEQLKRLVYENRIVVLKGQRLTTDEFVGLGRGMGRPAVYYEPMYHHPDTDLIFVSSNVPQDGKQVGVPKTGKFWHSDYQFMGNPFAFTLIYPQIIPKSNRGTYFIDMATAYGNLSQDLRDAVSDSWAVHSPRRYFKIRPDDVYRPVGELLEEIELKTPAVRHPAVVRHPATGESILYVSAGFTTGLEDARGNPLSPDLLRTLLEATGQLDTSFRHENIYLQRYEEGDLMIWDNRTLVHRALHTTTPEAAVSYRVTAYDTFPFHEPAPVTTAGAA
jgi:alpha-ketoglutarate-dependent taurine dioxygenase